MAVRKGKPIATIVPSVRRNEGTRVGNALGLKNLDTASLMKAAHLGLSWTAFGRFLDYSGFSQQDVAQYLCIAERTLARRREAGIFGNRESE